VLLFIYCVFHHAILVFQPFFNSYTYLHIWFPCLYLIAPALFRQFISCLLPTCLCIHSLRIIFYIFQTMSTYISFFKLTVLVSGLFHDFIFSVPFDAPNDVNIITVLVHYNHLYINGYFHGILLDFHVYYTLF